MKRKKISFVIPIIHAYPEIYATVNNIQTEMKDSPLDWEIIVCENSIVDENTPRAFTGPKALYRAFMRSGKLRYYFDDRQCGPVARNTGAVNATGDFVIFMDQHTTLGKDTIEPLAYYLMDHKECGLISGLTAWSHYDIRRLGGHYELFHPPEKQATGGGGPTLPTHMHGHYMPLGQVRDKSIIKELRPFEVVMGSQAYTMYRRDVFWKLGAYFEECRFYPHPEGYLPLKAKMLGYTVMVHPASWHIHGMYPRTYKQANKEKMVNIVNNIMMSDASDKSKLEQIRFGLMYNQPDDGMKKIREYGGWSWSEHGARNVLMIAYILGDEKWLEICYEALVKKHGQRRLPQLKESAKETVDKTGTREWLRNAQKFSLDEVLTTARKDRIEGMDNWFDKIGPDPLG